MKKYYSLVVSVLNKNGNRVDAHEIVSGSNKNKILKDRKNLETDIKNGVYDRFKNGFKTNDYTLEADIEVHNDDTWELLDIM